MNKKNITMLSLTVITALLLAACQANQPEITPEQVESVLQSGLIAEGTFEPHPSVELAFGMSGIVSQVFIQEGQVINQGDRIARLTACGPVEADLASAQAQLLDSQQKLSDFELYADVDRANALQILIDAQEAFDEAQNDFNDYDVDAYQDDLGEAQEDVLEAQDDLDEAIADLQEYLDLEEDNATRERYQDAVDDARSDLHLQQQDLNEVENDYRQAEKDFNLAAGQLAAAQAEYERKLDGPDANQLALLQSNIDAFESTISGLEEHLTACQVIAPFDGLLLFNDLQVGEFIQSGVSRLKLADTKHWQVLTDDVSEYDVVNIHEGQDVEVTADAIPGVTLAGSVISIDQAATLDHGDVTYTVTIAVEETPPDLRWGMTAGVRFMPGD